MTILRTVLLLLILCVLSISASAQSDYIKKGTSGLEVGAGFASNSDRSALGAAAGYSFSGLLDIQMLLARVSFDDRIDGEELNATLFQPSVSWFVVKQDSVDFPVTVSVNGLYQRYWYSSDGLDRLDHSMDGNFFQFGLSVYALTPSQTNLVVQPHGSIAYRTGKVEYNRRLGDSDSDEDNTMIFGLGVSLFFVTSPRTVFRIDPGLSISEDNLTFRLSASMIFPGKARKH